MESPFNDKLPPGWTAKVMSDIGEPISGVYDNSGVNIGFFKHDKLRPILFTDDDHLRYIWQVYHSRLTKIR